MASPEQLAALKTIYGEAKLSSHIFPEMAACEAMVETTWLTSKLGLNYKNLFGAKQSVDAPIFQTVVMPTWEIIHGQHVNILAKFVQFPSYADSFNARMETLDRLKFQYQAYSDALAATSPEDFVTSVSRAWSTDPTRASQCIAIYHAHRDIFALAMDVA